MFQLTVYPVPDTATVAEPLAEQVALTTDCPVILVEAVPDKAKKTAFGKGALVPAVVTLAMLIRCKVF